MIEACSREFYGLHGFLADSLPDGWGQLLMDRRLARHGSRSIIESPTMTVVGPDGMACRMVFRP